MIKYLIMDVDGTLTDGKIYMGPNGEVMKAFSIKDGYVINYILKPKILSGDYHCPDKRYCATQM